MTATDHYPGEIERTELAQRFALQLHTHQHDEDTFLQVFRLYVESRQVIQFHKDLFGRLNQLIQDHRQSDPFQSSFISFDLSSTVSSVYAREILSLAITQKLQLWHLCLDQPLDDNHFALELFCVLLLHFNCTPQDIPLMNLAEFHTCIEKTGSKLATLDLESERSSNRFVKLLKLCHSFGQLLVVFHLFSNQLDTKLADRFRQKLHLNPFNISPLHDYRDGDFWNEYLSKVVEDCIQHPARSSIEPIKQVCRLALQQLLFVDGLSFFHQIHISKLAKYSRKTMKQVLDICEQRPKLLFDLNIQQVFRLFDLDQIKRLIRICFVQYDDAGDVQFGRLLMQSFFKDSELFSTAMVHFVTEVIADVCTKANPTSKTNELLSQLVEHQSEWTDLIRTKPKETNSMWKSFRQAAAQLEKLKPK